MQNAPVVGFWEANGVEIWPFPCPKQGVAGKLFFNRPPRLEFFNRLPTLLPIYQLLPGCFTPASKQGEDNYIREAIFPGCLLFPGYPAA